MRPAAEALQARCGVPYTLFDRLTGLTATDALVHTLMRLSGRAALARVRRQRSQLVDALLDGHFHFGNRRIALAAEPDLLWAAGSMLAEMGAELAVCATTTASPLLARLPCTEVAIGDLADCEIAAKAAGCDLLMTHSHGCLGIPTFDRIGNAHKCYVGYRGTRQFVYEVGNVFMDQITHYHPGDWPLGEAALAAAHGEPVPTPAVFSTLPDPAVAHVSVEIPRIQRTAYA
jgi:nitrogenase molybdenum-iron protein NifN